MFRRYLWVLLLLFLPSLALGATYYASTSGSGSTCSIGSPCTLNGGIAKLSAGDTLYLRQGTYNQRIHPADQTIPSGSGTGSEAPGAAWPNAITIASYTAESATITGGIGIQGNINGSQPSYLIFDRIIIDKGITSGGAVPQSGAAFYTSGGLVHHIRFKNGEVKNNADNLVQVGGGTHHVEILNSNIHHAYVSLFGGTHPTTGNYGFYYNGHNGLIEGNTIHDNTGYGLHLYHSGGNDVDDNIIRNNIFYANGTDDGERANVNGAAIVASGANNLFYNNIVYGNTGIGVTIAYTGGDTNNRIYNNTIYNNSSSAIEVYDSAPGTILRNNIIYGNGNNTIVNWGASGFDQSNNPTTNPSFVNAGAADFHLQVGSSARDAGVTIAAVPVDIAGVSRPQGPGYDVGVYEYVVSSGGNTYDVIVNDQTVTVGDTVSSSWTVTPGPTSSQDWIGYFAVGAADTAYISRGFTNAALTGTYSVVTSASGSFEFRYCLANGFTCVDTSPTVVVSAAPPSTVIVVDSTEYGTSASLHDGVINTTGVSPTTVWASLPTDNAHWIEVDFAGSTPVGTMSVYWARDPNAGVPPFYSTSVQLLFQTWSGSAWVTQVTFNRSADLPSYQATFTELSTTKLRFYQPPNSGNPANFGDYFYVTEITWGVIAPPAAPVANFTGTPLTGAAPLSVQFTGASTGSITGYTWTFGDGSTIGPFVITNNRFAWDAVPGATQYIIHCGTVSGSYTLPTVAVNAPTLTVAIGSVISVDGTYFCVVEATNGVIFSPYSNEITFAFGPTNPLHVYAFSGVYTVTHTVTGQGGSSTKTLTNYVNVSAPPTPPPVANFSGTPLTGTAPLTVTFTDTSTGTPTSWAWTFGDGGTSTSQNPSRIYQNSGIYTVVLTSTNAGGSSVKTITNYVNVSQPVPAPPVASFTASVTSGVAPLNVTFTDTSTGTPTSWAWTFGSGEGTSTTQSPSHNYTIAGSFTVTLTATNAGGSSVATSVIQVDQPTPPPIAAFTRTPISGDVPLLVTFTDTSTGTPTSWAWTFGDGGTSTIQYPTHSYTTAGTYTVALTATNANGSTIFSQAGSVTATQPTPPPSANFTYTPANGDAPLLVTFTDFSTGVVLSRAWTFGDGGTSTATNPTHTYTVAGTYTVTLTATNTNGSTMATQTLAVTVSQPLTPPVANFTRTPASGLIPLEVEFVDASTGSPTSWLWDFGDGSTSTAQCPTHTYTTAGSFTVSLTATNANGSTTSTQQASVIVSPVPDPGHPGGTRYVDGSLSANCVGASYSRTSRLCEGSDGYGYKTMTAALQAMIAGDSVCLRSGTTWTEAFGIIPSGSAELPTVISNYDSEAVSVRPTACANVMALTGGDITVQGLELDGTNCSGFDVALTNGLRLTFQNDAIENDGGNAEINGTCDFCRFIDVTSQGLPMTNIILVGTGNLISTTRPAVSRAAMTRPAKAITLASNTASVAGLAGRSARVGSCN